MIKIYYCGHCSFIAVVIVTDSRSLPSIVNRRHLRLLSPGVDHRLQLLIVVVDHRSPLTVARRHLSFQSTRPQMNKFFFLLFFFFSYFFENYFPFVWNFFFLFQFFKNLFSFEIPFLSFPSFFTIHFFQ